MLRKFLISTVFAHILILIIILTTITEAASVTTLTSTAATTTTTKTPTLPTTISAARASNISATVLQLTEATAGSKLLNNAAEETTTSLLPLQPPLNVTSTTLASFILNQKHHQQQHHRKLQQQLYLQQQRQYRQLQDAKNVQKQQNNEQQPQIQESLLNPNANDNKEIKKKNLDSAFVTVKSAIDVKAAEPSSTHAYIPFDLDYNDPTEEKVGQQQSHARQATINQVLTNLFPKGFSDIFRFSYANDQDSTTTMQPLPKIINSTSIPFKPMPSMNSKKMYTSPANVSQNGTFITVSSTVTREVRREVSPGHTEIVVEKIITDPAASKSAEDFKDGSNSISKDELLRISRAAREASVLPSLLINPSLNTSNNSNETEAHVPIVILNDNSDNDDFVEAPEDDNELAETQDVVHQVIQPPPAESTNFHATPTHQYNVHIIHDNILKSNQDNETPKLENVLADKHDISPARNSPSYQTFVEQSKYLQNSLQEAPSGKFLKDFQNPKPNDDNDPSPTSQEKLQFAHGGPENHIQNVAPAAHLQYVQYNQQEPQAEALQNDQTQAHHQQELNTQTLQHQHLSDKDFYEIGLEEKKQHHTTPSTLVFVTINTPSAQASQQSHKLVQTYSEGPQIVPAQPIKSPHQFVSHAMGYSSEEHHFPNHHAEYTEENPKPNHSGYTFVEVQKSINIHNKLITEKDGQLVEQHETIYPERKYPDHEEHVEEHIQQRQPESQPSLDYVNLSQHPIHVEQMEEQHEPAASVREEQHAPNPAQDLDVFGEIQQSNLIQESHIIEAPQKLVGNAPEDHTQSNEHQLQVYVESNQQYQEQPQHEEVHQELEEHLTGEIFPPPTYAPAPPSLQIPYALPPQNIYQPQSASPMIVQEIVEKHIPVPYGVPEPVGIPVHIQHFIDRPFPVETIVEKPIPYPVEKVVEKVVEKHVPVEVEKIVEKPVEVIVKKYVDRPVAIPIKIPVSLHLPQPYGPGSSLYPPAPGNALDHASTWPQTVNGGTFARIPQNILKSYYSKMLKKLVPQMQQAYKANHITKTVPKVIQKPHSKPKMKISDILYDLKPPPPRSTSSWDVGARYQYDYNTLPVDLSASSSIALGKTSDWPGQGYKTNIDEFQRWRNGHSLKRSPDFGRNLHMEYGFMPPLVPSLEIDDKGVPLKAAHPTNGKND